MKAWLKRRLSERSTRFAAMLVIAMIGVAGYDLTVEQQSQIQTIVVSVIAFVMACMAEKPNDPPQ